ncbi:hypothetical protein ASF61_15030 [Duganella sp. Leaf126]|nr:hypothetical protein ASF61_15030 [Duganella sp. Leaf126]
MRRPGGLVTAEFSVVLLLFLLFTCGVLEVGRAMYLVNALRMVTQRAAAAAARTDFSDPAALQAVRQQAVMRSTPGTLVMGAPVSDAHVRIDYLSLSGPAGDTMQPVSAADMPACPVNNRIACMKDPYGAGCIRLVRARLCDPAVSDRCQGTAYRALFPLVRLPMALPVSTAIASADTLGASPGDGPCP